MAEVAENASPATMTEVNAFQGVPFRGTRATRQENQVALDAIFRQIDSAHLTKNWSRAALFTTFRQCLQDDAFDHYQRVVEIMTAEQGFDVLKERFYSAFGTADIRIADARFSSTRYREATTVNLSDSIHPDITFNYYTIESRRMAEFMLDFLCENLSAAALAHPLQRCVTTHDSYNGAYRLNLITLLGEGNTMALVPSSLSPRQRQYISTNAPNGRRQEALHTGLVNFFYATHTKPKTVVCKMTQLPTKTASVQSTATNQEEATGAEEEEITEEEIEVDIVQTPKGKPKSKDDKEADLLRKKEKFKKIRCHKCQRFGHLMRHCRSSAAAAPPSRNTGAPKTLGNTGGAPVTMDQLHKMLAEFRAPQLSTSMNSMGTTSQARPSQNENWLFHDC